MEMFADVPWLVNVGIRKNLMVVGVWARMYKVQNTHIAIMVHDTLTVRDSTCVCVISICSCQQPDLRPE